MRKPESENQIDISDLIDELARRLDLDKAYITEIEFHPSVLTVHLARGRDGRCKGSKYIDHASGLLAMEDPITFEVVT